LERVQIEEEEDAQYDIFDDDDVEIDDDTEGNEKKHARRKERYVCLNARIWK